jgi:hypothetical protein
VDDIRDEALFLCRSALIKSKTVSYAEQFEGLYALMRGFSAAFAVAVVYYLGWAYSSLWPGRLSGFVVMVGIMGALIVLRTGKRSNAAKGVTAAFLLLTALLPVQYSVSLPSKGATAVTELLPKNLSKPSTEISIFTKTLVELTTQIRIRRIESGSAIVPSAARSVYFA